jgi:hypothetical protein
VGLAAGFGFTTASALVELRETEIDVLIRKDSVASQPSRRRWQDRSIRIAAADRVGSVSRHRAPSRIGHEESGASMTVHSAASLKISSPKVVQPSTGCLA